MGQWQSDKLKLDFRWSFSFCHQAGHLSWTRHHILYVYYLKWLSLFFMWNVKICLMLITLFNLCFHIQHQNTQSNPTNNQAKNIDGFDFRSDLTRLFTPCWTTISHIFLLESDRAPINSSVCLPYPYQKGTVRPAGSW